jgi:hypothetical protein
MYISQYLAPSSAKASRSRSEKSFLRSPPVAQLLKNFSTSYGIWRFFTVFTRAVQWPLSWARSILSIPPHPISLTSISILSSHLSLWFPSGFFPLALPPKSYMHSFSPPFVLHALPMSSSLTWPFWLYFSEKYNVWRSLLCNFLRSPTFHPS